MSYEVQAESGLTVMGIFTRASNATPHLIGDLWRKAHAQGDAKAVAARQSDDLYCVYCEYDGDYTQPYTVVIGCLVEPDAEVPEGMKKVTIDAGNFALFPVIMDHPLPGPTKWAEIWTVPLNRRYQADYDLYGQHGKLTIHVGVR